MTPCVPISASGFLSTTKRTLAVKSCLTARVTGCLGGQSLAVPRRARQRAGMPGHLQNQVREMKTNNPGFARVLVLSELIAFASVSFAQLTRAASTEPAA